MTYHSIYIAWDLDTIVVEPVIRNASLSYFSICLQVWWIEITFFLLSQLYRITVVTEMLSFLLWRFVTLQFLWPLFYTDWFSCMCNLLQGHSRQIWPPNSVIFSYQSITSHICCAMYTKYTKFYNICIPQVIRFIKYNLQIINLLDYLNHSR